MDFHQKKERELNLTGRGSSNIINIRALIILFFVPISHQTLINLIVNFTYR